MRKDFDWLMRNCFFLVGPDSPSSEWEQDGIIAFCEANNFGHLMLCEKHSYKSAGWYESIYGEGHSVLKRFVSRCHAAGLIFTLHARNTRVDAACPLFVDPMHPELIAVSGVTSYIYPYGQLQEEISERLARLVDLIEADGLFLDGAEGGYAKTVKDNDAEFRKAMVHCQRLVIERLSRPIILQSSSTTIELKDHWCLSGHTDHYVNRVRSGSVNMDEVSRDKFADRHINAAKRAMEAGYAPQLGWLDFSHGQTYQGKPIEDQTPQSLAKLCDWAREYNVPIVLESYMEEINTHPQRDEMLAVLRAT